MTFAQSDYSIPLTWFGHSFTLDLAEFITLFTSILYEALPFIILGAIIAGLLEELLPQRLVAKLLPESNVVAILIGGVLGIIFPMCECGIIPVMRRLIRKGLPLSCCIAYLLAGPIINVIVILSTYVAFSGMETQMINGEFAYQMGGLWMTSLRVGIGYLVAIGTGLIVDWQYRKHGNALLTPLAQPPTQTELDVVETPEKRSLWQKISNISETALHDFIDITVFLILGAFLAAFVRQVWTNDDIAKFAEGMPYMSILVMMALAVALCLCSEADAFVAASFVTLRPAAKLSFLVLGPMFDFKLLFMYTRVFRPKLIWTIVLAVVLQVFFYCSITHVLWEKYAPLYIKPPEVKVPTTDGGTSDKDSREDGSRDND